MAPIDAAPLPEDKTYFRKQSQWLLVIFHNESQTVPSKQEKRHERPAPICTTAHEKTPERPALSRGPPAKPRNATRALRQTQLSGYVERDKALEPLRARLEERALLLAGSHQMHSPRHIARFNGCGL